MDNFIIYPKGGLCNKLRVIFSCNIHAKKINKKLIVIWNIHNDCNGYFLDYFEPVENITFIKYEFYKLRNLYKIYSNIDYIHHATYPIEYNGNMYEGLKLLPIISNKIKKNIELLENNYVSIHVRNTDLKTNISLNEYCNFIDKYETKNVYIASDNELSFNYFLEKYNNKIKIKTYYNSNNLRQTTLEDSIIDLYMCINSQYFMGTKDSSFTDLIYYLRKNSV